MCYHSICNFIWHGDVEAKYVPTKDTLANAVAKVVPVMIFEQLAKSLHFNE